jgi:hypothetical protein
VWQVKSLLKKAKLLSKKHPGARIMVVSSPPWGVLPMTHDRCLSLDDIKVHTHEYTVPGWCTSRLLPESHFGFSQN